MLRTTTKRTSIKPSVKLFPRLATVRRTPRFVALDRLTLGTRNRLLPLNQREEEATLVRARLLRMILNNESLRRNELRPSAS
ncbi:MAG: hypothetical protein U0805_13755 [Pirellulales bacterium]